MVKLVRSKEAIGLASPFATIEEEAEYWDSRSVLEAIEEGTLIGFHRARKKGTLTIRFEPEDIERLREEAHQQGIGPTTLVRMWVREHLRRQTPSSAS